LLEWTGDYYSHRHCDEQSDADGYEDDKQ